jgi:ring-1,2-phenylacetyl-CoA epoxidase subunit PaaC
MSFDNVYEAITEEQDDSRWAFGTGFADPLSGVDATVPPGVTADECLALGDDALIMSHRLQEWVTRAPELEDEVALANIGLDLLGQARLLLTRAGQIDGSGRGEDDFAFLRDEHEFRNVRLVELDDGHFGHLVARLFVFSVWRLALVRRLLDATDPVLAAIAAKAVKELAYHREYAAGWVVRLGDGTDLSHQRMQEGLDATWPYVPELGQVPEFDEVVDQVLAAATLHRPEVGTVGTVGGKAGRDGVHTERMGLLLADLQSVARAHPGATW